MENFQTQTSVISKTSPFCLATLEEEASKISVSSILVKNHPVYFARNLFHKENNTLAQLLEGKSSLFVVSENVSRLYGETIIQYLESKKDIFESKIISIESGEQNKNLQTIFKICEQAAEFSLKRHHPIIAIGGGICTDICGLAASLFRRGIPHLKIPTTLVGLIDAGIATKNGVNLGKRKNLLGTFTPPAASIIDTTFLETLSLRHITCGISESMKMGLVADPKLYHLWKDYGISLRTSRMQYPKHISEEVIRRSIFSMLSELTDNLYEYNSYKRVVDFGHTFSPFIEEVSGYEILHGEAVAIDMAISCQISYLMGCISHETLDEILLLFDALKLPIYAPCIELNDLWNALTNIIAHRAGNLNLVIPKDIGSCEFIEKPKDLDKACLKEAILRLANYKPAKVYQAEITPMEQKECTVLA